MKKQLFNALIVIMTAVPTLGIANPQLSGEVKIQDELIIFRNRLVCTAYAAKSDGKKRTDPKDLVFTQWTMGYAPAGNTSFMASGRLDGDLVSIHGDMNDSRISLSVQQYTGVAGEVSKYSYSIDGSLTQDRGVSLDFRRDGIAGSVSCGFQK